MSQQQIRAAAGLEAKHETGFIKRWADRWNEECQDSVRSVIEEIPLEEWDSLFEALSHRCPPWLITVERVSPDIGYRMQAENRPLGGILGIRSDVGPTILIAFAKGNSEDPSSWCAIPAVTHLWVKRSENEEQEAIEIEASDGSVTIIQFCAADATDPRHL